MKNLSSNVLRRARQSAVYLNDDFDKLDSIEIKYVTVDDSLLRTSNRQCDRRVLILHQPYRHLILNPNSYKGHFKRKTIQKLRKRIRVYLRQNDINTTKSNKIKVKVS